MTIADLLTASTLISAETSARAGIEGGCLAWRHASSMDAAQRHRCTARDDPHRRVPSEHLQQPACSRPVGVPSSNLSSRRLAASSPLPSPRASRLPPPVSA